MHPDVIPIEQLLEHRAWVRALARRLVIDESEVDDVEQQTWLAAIERPPKPGSARAWLGTVVRNVASKLRRKEARLAERHRKQPRGDSAPPTGDVVAQAELHRELVEAVLALDEPYRTTLLLRYFEGLRPREVARRTNTAVETVRTRTRRALEQVRRRLDDAHGQRRAWQLALAPLAGLVPSGIGGAGASGTAAMAESVGTGAVIMSMQTKIVLVTLALLLVVGVIVWNPFAGDAPEPPPVVVGDDDDAGTAEPEDPGLEGRGADGTNRADEPGPEDRPAPTSRAWLEVALRTGANTTRLRHLSATFVDADGVRHGSDGRDGIVTVPDSLAGPATLWLEAPDEGGLYRFDPRAYPDGPTSIEIVQPARVGLQFRTEAGLLNRAEVERRYAEAGHALLATWISEGRFTSVDPIRSRIDASVDGSFLRAASLRWEDDQIRVANVPAEGTWRLLISRAGGVPRLLEVPRLAPGEPLLLDVELPDTPSLQRVRVVAKETGDPLGGAVVTPFYEHGDDEAFFAGAPRTADAGGEIRIPYGGGSIGVRPPTWRIETGTHLATLRESHFQDHPDLYVFEVNRKATIRGVAYRADGSLAAGGLVICGTKGRMATTHVDEQGRFELADVEVEHPLHGGLRRERVSVVFVENLERMLITMTKVELAPGQTVEVQIGAPKDAGSVAAVVGRLTAGGRPLADQYVIVKGLHDTTKGAFAKTDADGRYRHDGLAPGPYEVRAYLGNPQVVDDFWIRTTGDDPDRGALTLGVGETTLDFDLPAGRLEVLVHDAAGHPLVGVTVVARPTDSTLERARFEGFEFSPGWGLLTGKNGRVTLLGLPPNVPLRLFGGQRESGWKFERENVEASTADEVAEIVIVKETK